MNEKWVYFFITLPFNLGLIGSVLHIGLDADRIILNLVKLDERAEKRIMEALPFVVKQSLFAAIIGAFAIPFIYIITRPFLWSFLVYFFSYFVRIHHSRSYSGLPISFDVLFKTFILTFILAFTWQFSYWVFMSYIARPPVSRGEYFTAKSPDRNGTLIEGLKNKNRNFNRTMAFLELELISLREKERRIEIFTDYDRKPVSAWESIRQECLKVLMAIDKNLKSKSDQKVSKKEDPKTITIHSPQTKIIPIKNQNIYADSAANNNSKLIQSIQDKDAVLSKTVTGALDKTTLKVRESISRYPKFLELITKSKYGTPLRFTLKRRVHQIIPNPTLTLSAVVSLTTLIACSRDEDKYGIVQRTFIETLDQMIQTLNKLIQFAEKPPIHWSDATGFNQNDLSDIYMIINALEEGLEEVIETFRKEIAKDLAPQLTARIHAYLEKLYSPYT